MDEMTITKLLTQTAAIVLAAGKGTRMHSTSANKVVLPLGEKPMIGHTIDHLYSAGIKEIITVVGFQADSVKQALGNQVTYAYQQELRGTGDAIKSALPALTQNIETVLAVSGDDSAFYPPHLFRDMVIKKHDLGCDLLCLTIHKDDPTGLGRIIRSEGGKILKIVEEKVATQSERAIKEINTGFYCFNREFLEKYLDQIQENPVSHEYYLTDLVEIALSHGKKVEAYFVPDSSIWQGVNKPEDLIIAQQKLHD